MPIRSDRPLAVSPNSSVSITTHYFHLSKFLDRIGGPAKIRDQILDALSSGVGVTARITWLPNPQPNVTDRDVNVHERSGSEHASDGKPRWIHCTPLMGSDEKVGVWMVVMVENETVTGSLNASDKERRESEASARRRAPQSPQGSHSNTYDPSSARNIPLPDRSFQQGDSTSGGGSSSRNNKMYQEYLRREGRSDQLSTHETSERPLHHRDRDAPTPPGARDGIQRARDAKSRAQSIHAESMRGSPGNVPPVPKAADSGYGRSPKTFPGELKPVGGRRMYMDNDMPGEPTFDDF